MSGDCTSHGSHLTTRLSLCLCVPAARKQEEIKAKRAAKEAKVGWRKHCRPLRSASEGQRARTLSSVLCSLCLVCSLLVSSTVPPEQKGSKKK